MEDEVKNMLASHEKRLAELEKKILDQKTIIKKSGGKKTIIDLLMHLKNEGFFDGPESLRQIVDKLSEMGYHYAAASLTSPLQKAVRKGILGRIRKDDIWLYVKR